MSKILLTMTALLITIPSAHSACIGYQNNITALEAVMAQHHKTKSQQYTSAPATTPLNHSLTTLEKAIKDHKAAQTTKTTTK